MLLLFVERLLLGECLLLLELLPSRLQPRSLLLLSNVCLLSSELLLVVRVAAGESCILRLQSGLLGILERRVDEWEGVVVLSGWASKLSPIVEEGTGVGILEGLQAAFFLFFGLANGFLEIPFSEGESEVNTRRQGYDSLGSQFPGPLGLVRKRLPT